MADTREQVAALNGAIRDRLVAAGHVDDRSGVVTGAGERLGVGDRVMTRRNDRDLARRQPRHLDHHRHRPRRHPDRPQRRRRAGSRSLPAGYVREHVELAYATTVHGAQGETTHTGHLAARRAHHRRRGLRRDDPRPRGQRGPPGRREPRRGPTAVGRDLRPRPRRPRTRPRRTARSRGPRAVRPPPPPRGRAGRPARRLDHANKTYKAPWPAARAATTSWRQTANLPRPGPPPTAPIDELRDQLTTATDQVRARLHEPAIRSLPPGRVEQEHADWLQHRRHEQQTSPEPAGRRSPIPGPAAASRPRLPEHT